MVVVPPTRVAAVAHETLFMHGTVYGQFKAAVHENVGTPTVHVAQITYGVKAAEVGKPEKTHFSDKFFSLFYVHDMLV